MKERNIRLSEEAWQLLWEYRDNLQVQLRAKPMAYPEELRGKNLKLSDAVCFLLRGRQMATARQKRYEQKLGDRRYTIPNAAQPKPCTEEGPAAISETSPADASSPEPDPQPDVAREGS